MNLTKKINADVSMGGAYWLIDTVEPARPGQREHGVPVQPCQQIVLAPPIGAIYIAILKNLSFFQGLTILCDSSSVRLVSSGKYDNSVTVLVKEATDTDIDYAKNVIMMCPGFN